MRLAVPLAAAALVVAACSPRPALRPGGDFSGPPEKVLFALLKEVAASDPQRLAIFQAWDETQPKLRTIDAQADELMREWQELDRRDPGFAPRAEAVAVRYGELSRQRLALGASFEGRVAAALDPGQWRAWQEEWSRLQFGPPGGSRGAGPPLTKK